MPSLYRLLYVTSISGQRHGLVKLNATKSEDLVITGGKRFDIESTRATLAGEVIPQVDTVKHLGVHISRDLRWKSHVHSLLEKVRGRIGVLRRISYRYGSFFLRQMYVAGIRSTLEYASVVWGNLTQADSLALERLQLQVAKIICHCNDQNKRSALLSRCGLPTLAWRRRRAQLLCSTAYCMVKKTLEPRSRTASSTTAMPR